MARLDFSLCDVEFNKFVVYTPKLITADNPTTGHNEIMLDTENSKRFLASIRTLNGVGYSNNEAKNEYMGRWMPEYTHTVTCSYSPLLRNVDEYVLFVGDLQLVVNACENVHEQDIAAVLYCTAKYKEVRLGSTVEKKGFLTADEFLEDEGKGTTWQKK